MRLLITGLAVLTLAGCQAPPPEPAANDAQPNESVVEDQLENEQADQAKAIENEAVGDNADVDND
ncbi:hypothetical protein OF829_12885 [Sphingomonas sp. LB-2]|uniref:hypothetical protein n=1 Tax=Sphingomonas caeni TaxID=2984949 RepID=UPI0022307330|nr:hypothetical protein [Sphingomonas caeni]MCW3848138.1 hypothetical protein [Sphingomonas caeni]